MHLLLRERMQICRTRVLVRSPSGAGQSARPRRCTRPTRSLAKCTPFVFRRVQTVQKAVTSLDLYTGQSYMGGQANSLSKRWVAGARWLGEPISGFCEAPDGTHGLCHRRHLGVGLPTRNIGVGFFLVASLLLLVRHLLLEAMHLLLIASCYFSEK